MENNREKQLLRHIEKLEVKISDLYEKINDLTYALERQKSLTQTYKERCSK